MQITKKGFHPVLLAPGKIPLVANSLSFFITRLPVCTLFPQALCFRCMIHQYVHLQSRRWAWTSPTLNSLGHLLCVCLQHSRVGVPASSLLSPCSSPMGAPISGSPSCASGFLGSRCAPPSLQVWYPGSLWGWVLGSHTSVTAKVALDRSACTTAIWAWVGRAGCSGLRHRVENQHCWPCSGLLTIRSRNLNLRVD